MSEGFRNLIKRILREEFGDDFPQSEPYDRDLHGYRRTTSFGEVPSVEEISELMSDGPFKMDLQGADSLAFDYAINAADVPGDTMYPEGMRDTLLALVNVPEPDELDEEQLWELDWVLKRWEDRYPDVSISETAQSLASSIMDVLGVEWI